MDPFITIIVFTVLVIGGVWGSVIISALMKRQTLKLEALSEDPRVDEVQEDQLRLEARLEQLEEEVVFFRELHKPETPSQLPAPEDGAT